MLLFISQGLFAQGTTPPPFRYLPADSIIPPTPPDTIPNTFYVSSSTGDDSNDGTFASPYQTLDKIGSFRLIPGDTVRFMGGDTITGSIPAIYSYNNFTETDLPITFNSYGTGRAIIKSSANIAFDFTFAFRIKITFRNLIFTGNFNTSTYSGNTANAIRIIGTPIYYVNTDSCLVLIDSCEFTKYKNECISINTKTFNTTGRYLVSANYFHDTGEGSMILTSIRNSNALIVNNTVNDVVGLDSTSAYGCAGMSFLWCSNMIVERNYLRNMGTRFLNCKGGIYFNGSQHSIVRYNEVRNVKYYLIEGAGIYYDCGSDNNRAVYNLIINCNRGMYISPANSVGDCQNGQPPQTFEDTLNSSNNVAAYNIIIVDSGGTSGISSYNTGNTTNRAKHTFIFNNLIITKRSHDVGKSYYPDSAKQITAINATGYYDSMFVYNNIFVIGDSTYAFDLPFTRTNTINSTYSDRFINGRVHNNIFYFLNGDSIRNSVEDIGTFYYNAFEPQPFNFYFKKRFFISVKNWADSTLLHKNGASYTYLNGNPNIKRVSQDLSIKINPWFLDTLTAFQFTSGIADNSGVNYNSILKLYSDTLTTDWYGNAIPYSNPDIGIYIKP